MSPYFKYLNVSFFKNAFTIKTYFLITIGIRINIAEKGTMPSLFCNEFSQQVLKSVQNGREGFEIIVYK